MAQVSMGRCGASVRFRPVTKSWEPGRFGKRLRSRPTGVGIRKRSIFITKLLQVAARPYRALGGHTSIHCTVPPAYAAAAARVLALRSHALPAPPEIH